MDSSRSGLLSTLLMTLPLIVVPAIVLLRPPGSGMGVSTSPLDAAHSDDDELLDEFDIQEPDATESRSSAADRQQDDSDEFDSLFAEVPSGNSKNNKGSTADEASKTEADDLNPFDDHSDTSPADASESGNQSHGSTEQIVEQLNVLGALRTMWFEAGPKSPVGFAVFFRGQTELTRIRFEAVGQSRDECARDVLDQVSRWQAEQHATELE